MRIVIFGANGATGRLLTRRALDAGHSVVAVTRHPEAFPITGAALTVAEADVRDAAAVAGVVDGADAVLSTLGVTFTMDPVDTYSVGDRTSPITLPASATRWARSRRAPTLPTTC